VLEQARRLVVEFKHTHITAEHIMLALLASGGPAVEAALSRGRAHKAQVDELIRHHLRPGDEPIPERLITFGERAKRVLEAAKVEAQRVRAAQVGPEHLIVGLTQIPNTICGAVLRAVGVSTEVAQGQTRE
jgi:ATP-dependent Clp protease ATP-binding subunit ClpC